MKIKAGDKVVIPWRSKPYKIHEVLEIDYEDDTARIVIPECKIMLGGPFWIDLKHIRLAEPEELI